MYKSAYILETNGQTLQDQIYAYETYKQVMLVFQEYFPEYYRSMQLLQQTIDELSKTVDPAYAATLTTTDRNKFDIISLQIYYNFYFVANGSTAILSKFKFFVVFNTLLNIL